MANLQPELQWSTTHYVCTHFQDKTFSWHYWNIYVFTGYFYHKITHFSGRCLLENISLKKTVFWQMFCQYSGNSLVNLEPSTVKALDTPLDSTYFFVQFLLCCGDNAMTCYERSHALWSQCMWLGLCGNTTMAALTNSFILSCMYLVMEPFWILRLQNLRIRRGMYSFPRWFAQSSWMYN